MRDILPELNGKDYINALNKEYEIRFLRIDEIEELVAFLKAYWRADHIFTYSRSLLDWQHLDQKNNRYNFVVAKHRKSNEIHSILGFVPTCQFDPDMELGEVWPCIWKSRDDIHVKGLGVSLYYYLKETLPIKTISILGISEVALSIYKHWNFKTGKIKQYFYPNHKMETFEILGGFKNNSIEKTDDITNEAGFALCEYSQKEFENINTSHEVFKWVSRYKSKQYYINRFLKHPVYKYTFLGVEKDGDVRAILVVRENEALGRKCVRVVDYIGRTEELCHVKRNIALYIEENGYEYMDFVEVGLSDEDLKRAGFVDRDEIPGVIVPNYFEPFLKENINLDYAYKTVENSEEIVFYKADADQDRPNIL